MYCRMEDERFSVLRHLQKKKQAANQHFCEFVANETDRQGSDAARIYLPASVPGSPRHLRKLRTDALELARRRGPPSYFITLTCNPYWPEILAALKPGQTAADRPDIVVRVFRGRLERLVHYLKTEFGGKQRYIVKVLWIPSSAR